MKATYSFSALLGRLLGFARPYLKYFAGALFCAIISVTLTLFGPVLIGKAVDTMVGPENVAWARLWQILLLFGLSLVFAALFQWLMSRSTNIIAQRTVRDLREAAFTKLSRSPLALIDTHSHGDLITRITTDMDLIGEGLVQGFTQLFSGVITILGTLVFMFSLSPFIATVVVVLTPLSIVAAMAIARATHRMFRVQSATRGELGGYMEEMIGNQKTVKTFGYEARAQEAFEKINARLHDVGVRAQFYSSLTNPSTRFINGLVFAAVGVTGALAAIRGAMSVGQITSFLAYSNQYTKPFNEISSVATELQNAMASARRIFSLLDEPDETPDVQTHVPAQFDGSVALVDVRFSYRPEAPLIENLNLLVKPGERVAIVGPTGCGKTTLINLLMRFYDVTSGVILTSGADIRDMPRSQLRRQFGMVLQDTWLFEGSARDNIAYGRPEATLDEVIAAAKAAHIHSFIKRLPEGYDTILRDDDLSQGQKQLLCIARVMLTLPPMLILDEATSSIDTRTEIRIQKAFATMMQGRTSFIVAHRLSTIREADTILVMDKGHIIEQGTHDELLIRQGFYAKLYNSQFLPS